MINLTAVSHIIQSYMHNPNQFQVIVSSRGYRRLNITLQETFIYTDVGKGVSTRIHMYKADICIQLYTYVKKYIFHFQLC